VGEAAWRCAAEAQMLPAADAPWRGRPRRRIRSAGRPACATARFGQRRHRINL